MVVTQHAYENAVHEDRCAPRTKLVIPSQLRTSGGGTFRTVVHDLSIAGFSASSIRRLQPGQACWLTLPGKEALEARIVWWNHSIAGAAFENMIAPEMLDDILSVWRAPKGGGVTRSCLF